MGTKAESAKANMAARKMNCAQCVFTAFSEDLGLDLDTAMKVAMGFGGGMGHTGKTCGAVTGAYMAIGLKEEKITPETKEKVYKLVREFDKKFVKIHGSTLCKGLLGYDISKEDEFAAAKEKNLFATLCPQFVHDAAEIVENDF